MYHYDNFCNFPLIVNIYILCGALYTSYQHTFDAIAIYRRLKVRSRHNYANSWTHVPIILHAISEAVYKKIDDLEK